MKMRVPMSRFGKISDGINKTNTLNRDGLTCRSFQHHQSEAKKGDIQNFREAKKGDIQDFRAP
jgi:hypothetical protein